MAATFRHLMKLLFELKKVARPCNSVGPRLLCVYVSVTPLPPVLIYSRVAMELLPLSIQLAKFCLQSHVGYHSISIYLPGSGP